MSTIYESIGRLVVRLVWWRFSREIKVAGVIGVALLGLAGYLAATREPPEG